MSESELNNLRAGWDFIIDIDCNWIDYSKKAAIAIIKALEYRGVKNIGIKLKTVKIQKIFETYIKILNKEFASLPKSSLLIQPKSLAINN